MDRNTEVLTGIAALAITALAAFALYRWWQRRRARRVDGWVRGYLSDRYSRVPENLSIDCSDDRPWPVLVGFDSPATGARHRLQFSCPGASSTFRLLAETEDAGRAAPARAPLPAGGGNNG
jgi:hypothetical protein